MIERNEEIIDEELEDELPEEEAAEMEEDISGDRDMEETEEIGIGEDFEGQGEGLQAEDGFEPTVQSVLEAVLQL